MKKSVCVIIAFKITAIALAQDPPAPDKIYGDLFREVQLKKIFPDNKTFVDCIPKRKPADILYDYGLAKGPKMDLKKFVEENFQIPVTVAAGYKTDSSENIVNHIRALWKVLRRERDQPVNGSTLLPLPQPYIVPGGRFREIYYWDSYFTMLGLKESSENDMIENMVSNFAYLVSQYGHIPNGNRSYYLSRSQPPFFALMLDLLAAQKGNYVYATYLPALQKEYEYFTDQNTGTKHTVKLPDGAMLQRYYDRDDIPRQESYREDLALADSAWRNRRTVQPVMSDRYPHKGMNDSLTGRHVSKGLNDSLAGQRANKGSNDSRLGDRVMNDSLGRSEEQDFKRKKFRELRSGAESGWDFSSRWFEDGKTLNSIQVTSYIPVDLNCLLYHLEKTLAKANKETGELLKAKYYDDIAERRRRAINKYCWSSAANWYVDYNFITKKQSPELTLAGMTPFFLNLADEQKLAPAKSVLEKKFLKAGGLTATLKNTGQQWDAPNGWAPLQWIAIAGLENYKESVLAREIAKRWIALNIRVFKSTGKLMEKYNVVDLQTPAGGGEYAGQDGFGWTNGVLLSLIRKYGAE